MVSPFQGWVELGRDPRALPWAIELRPVGAGTRNSTKKDLRSLPNHEVAPIVAAVTALAVERFHMATKTRQLRTNLPHSRRRLLCHLRGLHRGSCHRASARPAPQGRLPMRLGLGTARSVRGLVVTAHRPPGWLTPQTRTGATLLPTLSPRRRISADARSSCPSSRGRDGTSGARTGLCNQ